MPDITDPAIECRCHKFVTGGGRSINKAGKSHYPDLVRLKLSTNEAWRVATDLLSQLRRGADEPVDIALLGELTEKED